MKKIRYLILDSWTCYDDSGLLLVSTKPATAEQMNCAQQALITAASNSFEPNYDESGAGGHRLPKNHQKLMRILKRALPCGFQIQEVQKIVIS